jgi:ATP phosphoribosyltransferase
MNNKLTIALPKGRIALDTLKIFESIFGSEFSFSDRKLILNRENFQFLLVRNQDIPTYVEYGAADLGIVGLDVLVENSADVVKLLDLKIGKCKICIGAKKSEQIDYSKPDLKIATKMENIAKTYFAKRSICVDIIKLNGSIELAPLVNLCDGIIDLVETGSTMKSNGLEVIEEIMSSSAYLVANKNSYYSKKVDILDIYNKIKKEID